MRLTGGLWAYSCLLFLLGRYHCHYYYSSIVNNGYNGRVIEVSAVALPDHWLYVSIVIGHKGVISKMLISNHANTDIHIIWQKLKKYLVRPYREEKTNTKSTSTFFYCNAVFTVRVDKLTVGLSDRWLIYIQFVCCGVTVSSFTSFRSCWNVGSNGKHLLWFTIICCHLCISTPVPC